MEKTTIEVWLAEFNAQIDAAFRFSFPVRDRELQKEAADRLNEYLSGLDTERMRLHTVQDSDAANMFLAMGCYARSVIQLLRMWLAIRNDDPNTAWDLLISAQDSACAAMRAHRFCAAHMDEYSRHLEMLEHILFPRPQFVSSSFVIKTSECSLCNAPFHKCDHIAGFPYNGVFCVEVVHEVSAIDHVALVDFPADKRCRTTSFSENGYDIDSFTMRRTPHDEDKDSRTAKAIVMTAK